MSRYSTPSSLPPDRNFTLRNGIKTPSKMSEYRLNCPLCGDEEGKLYIDLDKGIYHCFRHGAKGKLDGALGSFGVQLQQAILVPKEKAAITPSFFSLDKDTLDSNMIKGYIESRRFPEHIIQNFGLKGAIILGSFAVAIPVITPIRRTLHWYFRLINHPNLKHYSDFPKRELLYGHEKCLTSKDLYMMEGPFDVLCSLPFNSVCFFGKIITNEQIELLKYFSCERFVICLDGSVDLKRKLRSCWRVKIETRRAVGILQLPPNQDPGNLGREILNYPVDPI